MDNLRQESLNKSRSYTACISAAHRMLFDNIRFIFRHTWLYVLCFALSIALFSVLYARTLVGVEYALSSYVVLFVSLALAYCLQILYVTRIFVLLNGKPLMWNLVRCSRLFVAYLCVLVLIFASQWLLVYFAVGGADVVAYSKLPEVVLAIFCLHLFFACVLLPYVYVAVKYLMEPESKLSKLILRAYKTGLRHWGFIFVTLFLAVLCVTVCVAFVSIPMIIIYMANVSSVIGQNYMGDPSGLPSYFPVLQYLVITVTSFIILYITFFIIFVCYYMYGSIEKREEEKKEFLKVN